MRVFVCIQKYGPHTFGFNPPNVETSAEKGDDKSLRSDIPQIFKKTN